MSDLNIRLNLDSTAAAAAAAGVQGDLNKLKTDAEKPIKINVDTSELAGAAGGAGRLKEALGNVQAAALGELSQKAAELGGHLGGVAGSIAEVAIKSAAAFGPMGIALTAVLAAVSLVVQGMEEMNKEARAGEELALIERNLGSAFQDVQRNVIGAKNATESLTIAIRTQQTLLAANAQLLNAGFNTEQIEQFRRAGRELIPEIQRQGGAFRNVTQAQLEQAIVSRDAGVLAATFGVNIRFTGNAAANTALAVHALEQRTRELSSSHQDSTTTIVRNSLALQENGKIIDLVAAASEAMDQAARDKAITNDRLQAARSAASSAETAAQRRAGIEALRVAEQGLLIAGREINVREQQTRAEQALAFAVGETARARAASESHGQTAAERTQLITSLNNEATARQAVADATQAQADRLTTLMERATSGTNPAGDSQAEETRFQQSLTRMQQEQRLAEGASKAQDAARAHTVQQQSTFTGRMNTLMGQQKGATEQLAGSAKNALTAVGTAMASHAQAMIQGKETIGAALQGMLKDVLTSIGSEAMIKGAMMMAEGAAALAGIYTAPLAAGNFAAGAAFFGVGALASAAGAAIPAASTGGGGGGGGAAGGSAAMAGPAGATPMRSGGGGSDEAPKNITINFSAFQSNEAAQALIVRSLREAGYNGRARVGSSFSNERR